VHAASRYILFSIIHDIDYVILCWRCPLGLLARIYYCSCTHAYKYALVRNGRQQLEEAEVDMSILVFMASVGSSFFDMFVFNAVTFSGKNRCCRIASLYGTARRTDGRTVLNVTSAFRDISCNTRPSYLRRLIQHRQHDHNLRSTTTTLCQPFTTTTFAEARLPMLCSGWLELTAENCRYQPLCYCVVTVLKSRLKTFLFSRAFSLPYSQ